MQAKMQASTISEGFPCKFESGFRSEIVESQIFVPEIEGIEADLEAQRFEERHTRLNKALLYQRSQIGSYGISRQSHRHLMHLMASLVVYSIAIGIWAVVTL